MDNLIERAEAKRQDVPHCPLCQRPVLRCKCGTGECEWSKQIDAAEQARPEQARKAAQ